MFSGRCGRAELVVLMLLLAGGVGATAVLLPGPPAPPVPTPTLAPLERPRGRNDAVARIGDVRPEERTSADAPEPRETLAALLAPPDIPALVADLADDRVRWNAHRAMRALRAAGEVAAPFLERALYSADVQQRRLAATLLRELDLEPGDRLLEVTAEALSGGDVAHVVLRADQDADAYLLDHAPRSWPVLLRRLFERDGPHFRAAVILAASRCPRAVPETCGILIEHLHDNAIGGDARIATRALYLYGRLALPYLAIAEAEADEQALQLLRLIQLDLFRPPETRADFQRRRRMHAISDVLLDPAVQGTWPRPPATPSP